jgi:hypothetical protein
MNANKQTASRRGEKSGTPKTAGARAGKKPDLSKYPDRWIKAPTRGRCPECGFTRPALYELAAAGKIKTASIRKPGAIRGSRLFHLGSIFAFLDAEAEKTATREVRP